MGKSYQRRRVSYRANVGASPEDEYVLLYHQDPKIWYGCIHRYLWKKAKDQTVSALSNMINAKVNGLQLPAQMVWYHVRREAYHAFRTTYLCEEVDIDEAPWLLHITSHLGKTVIKATET
jgi:hypothetical protein